MAEDKSREIVLILKPECDTWMRGKVGIRRPNIRRNDARRIRLADILNQAGHTHPTDDHNYSNSLLYLKDVLIYPINLGEKKESKIGLYIPIDNIIVGFDYKPEDYLGNEEYREQHTTYTTRYPDKYERRQIIMVYRHGAIFGEIAKSEFKNQKNMFITVSEGNLDDILSQLKPFMDDCQQGKTSKPRHFVVNKLLPCYLTPYLKGP
jgi:hypothetical protein